MKDALKPIYEQFSAMGLNPEITLAVIAGALGCFLLKRIMGLLSFIVMVVALVVAVNYATQKDFSLDKVVKQAETVLDDATQKAGETMKNAKEVAK